MDGSFERYKGIALFGVVLLTLMGVVLFELLRPSPQPLVITTVTPYPSPAQSPTPSPLQVYVSGAVDKPDVYVLSPGSIVKDAVVAAGGPASDADLDRINLAAQVSDGQHVYVPHLGEESPPVQLPSSRSASGGTINVNSAALSELDLLPGIGPALAQRIIDYREAHGPFADIHDITEVSGIGESIFQNIQDLITTD